MPEWTNCPSCRLRHTRRPDGLCPRCKTPLDGVATDAVATDAVAEPAAEAPAAVAPPMPSLGGLGKLAQSARTEKLKGARSIMLFVGIMSILANGVFYALAAGQVDQEFEKELAKLPNRAMIDMAKVQELKDQAVRTAHLITGGGVLLGLLFVGCGISVYQHPVPSTVTGLALYLGGNAIFGVLNPQGLTSGIIIKVFITIGLFKAVQAAIAFQKEQANVGGA